jgi:hypothetical protein
MQSAPEPVSVDVAAIESNTVDAPAPDEVITTGDVEVPTFDADAQATFDLLTSELGEIQELKLDSFYKDIKPTHVKELPTAAKQILHNVRKSHDLKIKSYEDKIKKEKDRFSGLENDLKLRESEFSRRQSEWAAMIQDPKVLEALKSEAPTDADHMTMEGQQKLIAYDVSQKLSAIFKPMQESAEKIRRESAWRDFVEKNPDVLQPEMKERIRKEFTSAQARGEKINTQTAHQLAKLRKLEADASNRALAERQARAQSARHVAKIAATGTPAAQDVPPEVMKGGTKAIYAWLKSNPEAKKRIDASR